MDNTKMPWLAVSHQARTSRITLTRRHTETCSNINITSRSSKLQLSVMANPRKCPYQVQLKIQKATVILHQAAWDLDWAVTVQQTVGTWTSVETLTSKVEAIFTTTFQTAIKLSIAHSHPINVIVSTIPNHSSCSVVKLWYFGKFHCFCYIVNFVLILQSSIFYKINQTKIQNVNSSKILKQRKR